MLFRMVYKFGQIFLPFCHNSHVWRTDRQNSHRCTASAKNCIPCSAVKITITKRLPFSWRQTTRQQDTQARFYALVTLTLRRWPWYKNIS